MHSPEDILHLALKMLLVLVLVLLPQAATNIASATTKLARKVHLRDLVIRLLLVAERCALLPPPRGRALSAPPAD